MSQLQRIVGGVEYERLKTRMFERELRRNKEKLPLSRRWQERKKVEEQKNFRNRELWEIVSLARAARWI